MEECDDNIRFEREKYYVDYYKSYGVKGYNATLGGDGFSCITKEDEEEILNAYYSCNTISGTRNITNRNCETIHNILCKNGIDTNKAINIDIDSIKADIDSGMSIKDMAKKYNCCKDTIRNKIRKNKLISNEQKLKEDLKNINKQYICDLYNNGKTACEIVKILKNDYKFLNSRYVCKILKENGIITSRFLNDKLILTDVIDYYKKCKNISKTAKYFNVNRNSVKNFLDENNILENKTKKIILKYHDETFVFYNFMDCARFVKDKYLKDIECTRGLANSISRSIKNHSQYRGINFYLEE